MNKFCIIQLFSKKDPIIEGDPYDCRLAIINSDYNLPAGLSPQQLIKHQLMYAASYMSTLLDINKYKYTRWDVLDSTKGKVYFKSGNYTIVVSPNADKYQPLNVLATTDKADSFSFNTIGSLKYDEENIAFEYISAKEPAEKRIALPQQYKKYDNDLYDMTGKSIDDYVQEIEGYTKDPEKIRKVLITNLFSKL